jgi:predicted enzyme related to lactoylglutathione lyase
MSTPQFTQIRLLADDFAASFLFYRDVLGFEPQADEQESGPYACFKAKDGGTDIALFSRQLMGAALGADPGPAGGAVLVLKVDDVDATYAKVVANGAEAVAEPMDQAAWGMRVAHVCAPEGTLIEFCAY